MTAINEDKAEGEKERNSDKQGVCRMRFAYPAHKQQINSVTVRLPGES